MIVSNFDKRGETWAKGLEESWREVMMAGKCRMLDFKSRVI
jgi:hypothetical protein